MDYSEIYPQPSSHQVNYNWKDVTQFFFKAVQNLQLGELLHDDMFGLFEAMSAIEMMDPKMDAGMVCNRGIKKDKAEKLKISDFQNGEIIGIMDTTLACIVSWLEGHSLAQTVFTNLYLHKPYNIENKVLKSFSLVVYKLIDIIKDFIHKAMVFEEEDFQPMQYGYRLNPEISDQRVIGMLREVEDDLQRELRTKQSQIKSDETEEKCDDLLGLHARVRFVRSFYQALNTLLLRSKEDKPSYIPECLRLLNVCSDALIIMKRTVDCGIQSKSSDRLDLLGFEPLINQRLLPPTFPRYTKIKPSLEALIYFETMVDRLKVVCKITGHVNFHSALDFFLEFSKTGPCLLSRSALQLLYLGHGIVNIGTNILAKTAFVDVLREAARSFFSPNTFISKVSPPATAQAKVYINGFLQHCTRPFASYIQLCGHNRARQRDKLAHLLEEFISLQDEAERVDLYLHKISSKGDNTRMHKSCFGTWVLYHTLCIMVMYLLAGFELELYSIHEYYYIFWYLYEFLYGWLVSALTRADNLLIEQEVATEMQKGRGNKKVKTKLNKRYRSYGRELLYYQAMQHMCGGFFKALYGFRMDGKITMPHPQFDSEQVRYEHRFAPFAGLLTPPPVQYAEFRDMTSPLRQKEQLIDSAYLYLAGCHHFGQARALLEKINPADQEIKDLLMVAKTNFVVLKLLAGGHKKDSTTPPEFDFSTHRHLPVIRLM